MKKNTLVTIIIVLVLLAGAGVSWYLLQQSYNQPASTEEHNTSASSDSTQQMQTPAETQPATGSEVTIKGFAFSPATIKVKKGTTVTWTNQDSVGHNVLVDDPANSGGLPTSAGLLDNGQTFSHTFDQVGSFAYHCGPHPNMKGTVEVTE